MIFEDITWPRFYEMFTNLYLQIFSLFLQVIVKLQF